MPALNYKAEFAHLVEQGLKPHTIRAKRKYPIRRGDRLYHYTGMRTKGCRKLGESICLAVQDILITENEVRIDGSIRHPNFIARIAKADGFKDQWAFRAFFKDTYGLPFCGQLIYWNPEELIAPK